MCKIYRKSVNFEKSEILKKKCKIYRKKVYDVQKGVKFRKSVNFTRNVQI